MGWGRLTHQPRGAPALLKGCRPWERDPSVTPWTQNQTKGHRAAVMGDPGAWAAAFGRELMSPARFSLPERCPRPCEGVGGGVAETGSQPL